jgi:ankyrin repeat protein
MVQCLLEHGANALAKHALFSACKNGHLEVVKWLVEYGADVKGQDGDVLRVAWENGYFDIVKYLLQKGAKWIQN